MFSNMYFRFYPTMRFLRTARAYSQTTYGSTPSVRKRSQTSSNSFKPWGRDIEVKTNDSIKQEVTVYVHWPFCKQICTFCNFNKYVRDDVNQERMRDCLVQELKTILLLSGASKVKSVYFGGGTPSLAKPSTIASILDCITSICQMDGDAEVSLEANPSSSLPLSCFKASGINRLSLGIQSLHSKDLALFGRDHTVQESLSSLQEAKSLFPGKVSVDLIFGRPHQTVTAWKKELQEVLSICDRHLSLYQLTLERGTPLCKDVKDGHIALPSADVIADLYQLAVEVLENEGFNRYEVSSFAKSGSQSQHNMSYWTGSSYIGVGPGAHSRYYLQDNNKARRFACVQTPEPNAWMSEVEQFGHATRRAAPQSIIEILEELLTSGLRTKDGLTKKRWRKFAPIEMGDLSKVFSICQDVEDFIDADLLIVDDLGIRATSNGLNVVDSIATALAMYLEQYVIKNT